MALLLVHLPGEILLHIISYLDVKSITRLHLISRQLRHLARDASFWRSRCLDESTYIKVLARLRLIDDYTASQAQPVAPSDHGAGHGGSFADGNVAGNGMAVSFGEAGGDVAGDEGHPQIRTSHGIDSGASASNPDCGINSAITRGERERVRIMANWDPSFPTESVSWFDEYIHRHGPARVNWFALPRPQTGGIFAGIYTEVRGLALYRPGHHGDEHAPDARAWREPLFAVAPLDDGSVCLWDVNGTKTGKRGAIVSVSQPGILSDSDSRSQRVDSGVKECVSVNSGRNRAYFAVQSHIIEVDLNTLQVVDVESYPWSITALSAAHANLPLTVGTSHGIHLHDWRLRKPLGSDAGGTIDGFDRAGGLQSFFERGLRQLFDDTPLPPYAPISPGPVSILHVQQPGSEASTSDDIYAGGRFSNILHFDRRKFPSLCGSIFSGARISDLTSLPYPFSTLDSELRRHGKLSVEQVGRSKAVSGSGGRTLIAVGEYNLKGSLELYGLSPQAHAKPDTPWGLQNSTFRNRQTCADSKVLAVATHGTRIALSDGSGYIRWWERDGFTEVRRVHIGNDIGRRSRGKNYFASTTPRSDGIARKLVATGGATSGPTGTANDNDLVFWTGERLGMVAFTARAGVTSQDFEEDTEKWWSDHEGRALHEKGREARRLADERQAAYEETMRWTLERQADDMRAVRGLGLSGRSSA